MNLKMKTAVNNKTTSSVAKHPKVSEMVLLAIAILNERNGSSLQAIKKYISTSFNVEEKKISAYIKKYLLMAVASGTLIQTKGKGAAGSFRLGGCMKYKMSELLAELPNKTKTAASPCDTHRDTKSEKGSKKIKKAKTALSSTRAV
ncbi:Histone H1-III, partial [Stegodyphus mimosarum]